MTKMLPLYANLIYAFLFLFSFTGTWALLNDFAKLDTNPKYVKYSSQIKAAFTKLRFRRILLLFGAAGMIVFYFLGKGMMVGVAIIFGLFWFDTLSLVAQSRRLVNKIIEKTDFM